MANTHIAKLRGWFLLSALMHAHELSPEDLARAATMLGIDGGTARGWFAGYGSPSRNSAKRLNEVFPGATRVFQSPLFAVLSEEATRKAIGMHEAAAFDRINQYACKYLGGWVRPDHLFPNGDSFCKTLDRACRLITKLDSARKAGLKMIKFIVETDLFALHLIQMRRIETEETRPYQHARAVESAAAWLPYWRHVIANDGAFEVLCDCFSSLVRRHLYSEQELEFGLSKLHQVSNSVVKPPVAIYRDEYYVCHEPLDELPRK